MKLKKFLKTVKAICASAGDCTGGKCPFVEKHKNYFDCAIGQDGVPEKWNIKKISFWQNSTQIKKDEKKLFLFKSHVNI